jgi:hypothetical protein
MKIHNYSTSKATVSNGKAKNPQNRAASIRRTPENKTSEVKIMQLLTKIPIAIENPTKPFLYSFFTGLKKVRSNMGTEKKSKNAPLNILKYFRIENGACPNQNPRI